MTSTGCQSHPTSPTRLFLSELLVPSLFALDVSKRSRGEKEDSPKSDGVGGGLRGIASPLACLASTPRRTSQSLPVSLVGPAFRDGRRVVPAV